MVGEPYRLLDHTADLRVEIRGRDLPELFANAALALFDLLTDRSRVRDAQRETVSVEGVDPEDLLAEWLREHLFRYHANGRLCGRVETPRVGATACACTTWGETFDAARHEARHEIKAVTYHGLFVREEAEGWVAQVVLDV